MPKFIDRTGEESTSFQGYPMRIIRYGSSKDVDVLFIDTGYIAKNKYYRDFKHGLIRDFSIHRKNSVNYDVLNKRYIDKVYHNKLYNMNMTIIEYSKETGASILFEDGYKMENVPLNALSRGTVSRPDYIKLLDASGKFMYYKNSDIIGKLFKSELYGDFEIVRWGSYTDIDIKFLIDSTLVTTSWYKIKSGTVIHPNKGIFKVGEEGVNNEGYGMKIISYRNCNDIDVEFEDKTIIYGATYYSFKHGSLRKPFNEQSYLGKIYSNWQIEKFYNREYVQAKCLLCDSSYKNIRFYDITSSKSKCCVSCSRSISINNYWGNVYRKKVGSVIKGYRVIERVDKTYWLVECIFCNEIYKIRNENLIYNYNGSRCKCQIGINYNNNYFKDIKDFYNYLVDIYKDGTINYSLVCDLVKNGSIDEIIKRCEIKAKYGNSFIKDRLGQQNIMKNGQLATIVDLTNSHDLVVRFEDGTEISGQYRNFKRGVLENPNFRIRYSKRKREVVVKGSVCGSFNVLDFAYRLNKPIDVYYICQCRECGKRDILTPQQMLEHKCDG